MSSIREIVLPSSQRWDLGHLRDHLDLLHGDRAPKVSAFWTMLTLSAVIAVAGVLGNSTATVIGAMIIAPLGVPIMGIALGIVRGDGRMVGRSAAFVAGGLVLVVGIGLVASAGLPQTTDLLTNPQVTGRSASSAYAPDRASGSWRWARLCCSRRTWWPWSWQGPSPSRHTGMRRRWRLRGAAAVCAAAAPTQPSPPAWCSF